MAAALSAVFPGTLSNAQNITADLPTGTDPGLIAVNPVTGTIYVCDYNSVNVFNGSTNTASKVSLPSTPEAIAVNPLTNKIYTANGPGTPGSVTVIDGSTNTASNVTVGGTPVAVAVNPVTDKIYVANNQGASVSVIDGATATVTATVPTGTNPSAIAINTATNTIYVANYGSSNVTVIDGATNTTATISNVGSTASGTLFSAIALNPVTNKIYVVNGLYNQISVIDGTDNSVTNVTVGAYPAFIAVNPVTNTIYVTYTGNVDNGGIGVINGSTNVVQVVTDPNAKGPNGVAVDATTDRIYVANAFSNNITVLDGMSNKTTTLTDKSGTSPNLVGINPVTNRVYISNYGSQNVTLIDGATNISSSITASGGPAAFNPATNTIYVVNKSAGNVIAINGASGTTSTITVGASPLAIAVNPATNKIYVAGSTLTVIDGATNATSTISCTCNSNTTESLAVNPVTNKIYLGVATTGVYVIDGATGTLSPISGVDQTFALAVNPATNTIYASNTNNNLVTAINGANNSLKTISVGSNPAGLDVNPITNTVYVANSGSGNVTVINGSTDATSTVTDPSAVNSSGVVVNPVSNRVYVLNSGYDGVNPGSVTVINGSSNTVLANITASTNSTGIAVNPATNKIYAISNIPFAPGDLTVIDGVTDSSTHITLPTGPSAVVADPITSQVYVVSGTVSVFAEEALQTIPISTSITPLANNQSTSNTPTFTFSASDTFKPAATPVDGLFFQVDSWQGNWLAASGSGGSFTGTAGMLQPGFHILYAYSTDTQESTSNQGGSDGNPIIGGIAAYGFLVAAAPANTPVFSASPSPVAFGSQTQGSKSAAMTLSITNIGTATLNISTVTPGGADSADFPIASDNCVGAAVAVGSSCSVMIAFDPSAAASETATLSFADNASGTPHVVDLTGTGVAPVATASTTTLSASATSLAVGSSVTFTATVSPASGTPTPTGSVVFKDGSNTLCTSTLNGSGAATCTTTGLAIGMHSIAASYGGDSRNLASASSPLTVTVAAAASTTSLTASASSVVVGASVTFTATVQGAAGALAPTGNVVFKDGTTSLGSSALNSSGVATLSTTALAAGSHTVTAAYAGDANNAASTSTGVSVSVWSGPADFTLALSPSSGTVAVGKSTAVTITLTSVNGFNAATNLTCAGLPKNTTCSFSSSPLTPSVSGTATSTLTIQTNTKATTALDRAPSGLRPERENRSGAGIALAGIGAFLLLWPCFAGRRRKGIHSLLGVAVFAILALASLAGISACGGGPTTPKGNYSIQITATAGSISHSATYSLTVQ